MIIDEIKMTGFELQIFVFSYMYTAMYDKQKTLSDFPICYIQMDVFFQVYSLQPAMR